MDLLEIFFLDADAQRREQHHQLYAASKDIINVRRREICAQKNASEAATFQTNNGSVLSEHENLLDGDDDSWLHRNNSYTRAENVVLGKCIIKFIIPVCLFFLKFNIVNRCTSSSSIGKGQMERQEKV
jgi:hypothetical protein